jgi:hypothetical protein
MVRIWIESDRSSCNPFQVRIGTSLVPSAYINGILQRKGDTMNKSLADMQGFPAGFPSFPSFPQQYYPAVPPFYQQSHQPFGGYGYGQPFSQAYSPLTTPSAMYSSYPYTSDFSGSNFQALASAAIAAGSVFRQHMSAVLAEQPVCMEALDIKENCKGRTTFSASLLLSSIF